MSDPNDPDKGTKHWINLFPDGVRHWVTILPILKEYFRRITLLGQYILAALGLAFAIYHVYQWEKRSTELSKRIESSFEAKLDNTVWQHKGLAAFLLSDIEPAHAVTPPDSADAANVRQLELVVKEIRSVIPEPQLTPISTPVAAGNKQVVKPQPDGARVEEVKAMVERVMAGLEPKPAPSPNLTLTPRQIGLDVIKDPSAHETAKPTNQALMAGGEQFFLFLPATALRRQTLNYEPLETNNKESLKAVLVHNPDVVLDLSRAIRLIGEMEKLDSLKIEGQRVVQSYFITESGLILIRSSNRLNQLLFYERYFDPNHSFTDRAYFWGAVKALKEGRVENNPPPPFVYESEPYIDLGGHGLIKTYSIAFELANGRYGVLCADVETAKSLRDTVVARLNALKPDDATNTFEEQSVTIDQKGNVVEQKLPDDFKWFSLKLTDKSTKPASLLGRIASEDAETGDVHRYTIPWERQLRPDGLHRVELMLVRINLNQFWSQQWWRVAYICLGFGVFLAVTLNIFRDHLLLNKQVSKLAETVDWVMTHALNPYVRLNSDNEFVAVNDSFLNLLGYQNEQDLKDATATHQRTFLSLLTPDSQRAYDEILQASGSGLPTREYTITLYQKSEEKSGKTERMIRALVQGERIVFPVIRREKYPHRFGIIISAREVNERGEETPIELGRRVKERNEKRMDDSGVA